MTSHRIFLGIFPDTETREKLESLIHGLQRAQHFTPCKASWVPPERLHMTWQFIGSFKDEKMAALKGLVEETVSNFQSVPSVLRKIGYFPEPKNPKVLWVGVEDESGQIRKIAQNLREGCSKLDIELPDHRFLPHLTLARFKSMKGTGAFQNHIRSYNSGKTFGEWNVDRIEIIETSHNGEEPEYRALHSYPLSEPNP